MCLCVYVCVCVCVSGGAEGVWSGVLSALVLQDTYIVTDGVCVCVSVSVCVCVHASSRTRTDTDGVKCSVSKGLTCDVYFYIHFRMR